MPQDQQQSQIPNVFKILGIEPTNDPKAVQEAIKVYKRREDVLKAKLAADREVAGGDGPSEEQKGILEEFKFVTGFESQLRGDDAEQKLRFYNNSLSGISEGSISGGLGGGRQGFTDGFMGMDPLTGRPFNIYGKGNGLRPDLSNPDAVFSRWRQEAKSRVKVPYYELGLAKAIFQARKNPGVVVSVGRTSLMDRHIKAPSETRYGLEGHIYQLSVGQNGDLSVKVNPNHFRRDPVRNANELVDLADFLQNHEKEGLLWDEQLMQGLGLFVKIVDRDSNQDALHLPTEAVSYLRTVHKGTDIPFGPPSITFDKREDLEQELNVEGADAIVRLEYQPPTEGREGVSSIL